MPPGASIPMDAETLAQWSARRDRAWTFAQQFHPQWDRALNRYSKAKVAVFDPTVNSLKDFAHVEAKKAQLFHRTPEVNLLPLDGPDNPDPLLAAALPFRQKYLNYQLGPSGANAKRALHATLAETLASSGFMAIELGYENRTQAVPHPSGALDATGSPVTVQVPVWERLFITEIPAKRLLIADEFHTTNFDEAPWLGYRGTIPVIQARQMGWTLPDDFAGSMEDSQTRYQQANSIMQSVEPVCEYEKIWYRAAFYDATVVNPDLYRCLVLVKGMDQPAYHADSPYQELDPQTGQLTDTSMVGNPLHLGTLRDLPDSAFVPSDVVVGEQLSTEINKFRTDLIRNRRARRPLVFIDSTNMDHAVMEKISTNDGPIMLPAGALAGGAERLFTVVSPGQEPRDNYTAQDYANKDYEDALGVGANQQGQFAQTKRTATEVRTVQGNSAARAETERDRVREYFAALVRKFDTLVQRYATQQTLTKVLGPQGSALWELWQAVAGRYVYNILPDAGTYADPQAMRAQVLNEYQLFRKDPRVNVDALLTHVARALGYDPHTFLVPPQPAAQHDAAKVSVAIRMEDVLGPASQATVEMLTQLGFVISPQAIQALKATVPLGTGQMTMGAHPGLPGVTSPQQTTTGPMALSVPRPNVIPMPHPGMADKTEPLNKHQEERTGGVQGVGA